MLKHLENTDRHLASIDGSLAAIAHVFVKIDESGLLERLAAEYGCHPDGTDPQAEPMADPEPIEPSPNLQFVATEEEIAGGEWMSRKEAWNRLGIVKSTLEGMISAGELPSYHKQGDEHKKKPRVWLRRADVNLMYSTYTLRKGKEKK